MRSTDEELVRRAQADDTRATEELIRRYQQKAYAIVARMCDDDEQEAQDLTQEAFLRAFRNLKGFRGKSSFYTWFYRVVVNTCLDGRRKKKRWRRLFSRHEPRRPDADDPGNPLDATPDPSALSDPLNVLSGKQLSREIRSAMNGLPDKQRMAFQLKVLHGMSIREIAAVMNAAEGTVKSHLFRATRHMRAALDEWVEG